MSESLNRAFIKAYGKEKNREVSRPATATTNANSQIEGLIMRIDTSSVEIPSPHVFSERPVGRESVASYTSPRAATRRDTRSQEIEQTAHQLRAEIASQMLAAGSVSEVTSDAIARSLPMFSAPYITTLGSSIGSTTVQSGAGDTTAFWDASRRSVESLLSSLPNESSDLPDLEKPLSPALERSAESAVRTSTATSSDAEQRAVSDGVSQLVDEAAKESQRSKTSTFAGVVKQKNQGGAIFRLDKPSYSKNAPLPDYDDEENDSSISVKVPQSTLRSESVATVRVGSIDDRKSRVDEPASHDEIFRTEERLRRSRVRIFNPVWEVDSLQWPVVCNELLERMSGSMNKVAQNLISACEEGLQILAVTSPHAGEGSTTVACCLAKLAGLHGLKVAIVDADIDNPTLSYQTNLEVDQDWYSALLNEVSLEEVAVHSIDDQVTLVPLLSPVTDQQMLTTDTRIAGMMQELSESFDLVIVDAGDMATKRSLVTALGEQGMIHAVVAVVDHRSSTRSTIEHCLQRIRNAGIQSIGMVENFAA